MAAKLTIIDGTDKGREIRIKNPLFKIGRSADNDLILMDDKTSRFHAEISGTKDGFFFLKDNNSLNGTTLNGQKAVYCSLKNGDIIQIGRNRILFHAGASLSVSGKVELINDEGQVYSRDYNRAVDGRAGKAVSEEDPTSIVHKNGDVYSDASAWGARMRIKALAQVSKALSNVENEEAFLKALMNILLQTMPLDRGGIFLYSNPSGKYETFAFHPDSGGDEGINEEGIRKIIEKFARKSFSFIDSSSEIPIKQNERGDSSVIVSAIKTKDMIYGFLCLISLMTDYSYSEDDLETLEALCDMAATGIERTDLLKDNRDMSLRLDNLNRHLSPEVAKAVSGGGKEILESPIEAHERELTILFSDICDFTGLSERLAPPEIAALLNGYFSRMVETVIANKGTVNKFIGDAVMALFGAPIEHGNDAENAVFCAMAMIEALKIFHGQIDEKKRFNIRIGINTGNAVVGVIGSEKRMEYTALGDTVNCASRIESLAPPNGVAVGENTYLKIKDKFICEPIGQTMVKGKSQPLNVYIVKGVKSINRS